jgi:Tol biopolymer transport system component
LYPTGAGDARRLDPGSIERYTTARWFPDGTRVVVCGSRPGTRNRCFEQDIKGGAGRPIATEGALDAFPAPDGTSLLVYQPRTGTDSENESAYALQPMNGATPRPIPWIRDGVDSVVGWSPDGKSVLVSFSEGTAFSLVRVDMTTGRRDIVRTLNAGVTGSLRLRLVTVGDDPDVYAYQVAKQLSRMYLIRGAR